jgi:hypothetical protein
VSTSIQAIVVSVMVGGFLLWTGIEILKTASLPQTPSRPALPTAQVMANRHSPLREPDPEREGRVGRVILTLVGLGFLLVALGVFGVGLALAGYGY